MSGVNTMKSQNWIYIDPCSKSQMIKGKIYIVTVMEEHQFLKQSQTRISTSRICNGSNCFIWILKILQSDELPPKIIPQVIINEHKINQSSLMFLVTWKIWQP